MLHGTSVIEAHVHTAERFRTNLANCPRICLATVMGTFGAFNLERNQIIIFFCNQIVVCDFCGVANVSSAATGWSPNGGGNGGSVSCHLKP